MSLNQLSSDKNAERVCSHKLKFTMGRTILRSHLGAFPTSRPILRSAVSEFADVKFKGTFSNVVRSIMDLRQ